MDEFSRIFEEIRGIKEKKWTSFRFRFRCFQEFSRKLEELKKKNGRIFDFDFDVFENFRGN